MKNKKKYLRQKADKLWYQLLLKDKCLVCPNKAIQVHHYYYKGQYGFMRYDLENGISLCQSCHFILHHSDPKRITDKIEREMGKKWKEKLLKQESRKFMMTLKKNLNYLRKLNGKIVTRRFLE